jgi:hypothetical protein
VLDEANSFELSKAEFSALYAFTGGPRIPCTPIFFRPSVDAPEWPTKKAMHVAASDGHTMVTHLDDPFEGKEFWLSREVAGLLKGAIPSKGYIRLAECEGEIAFEVWRGRRRYGEDSCLLQGAVDMAKADDSFARGYASYGIPDETKPSRHRGALQTKYLSRLELVRKAVVNRTLGAEICTGQDALDPVHFLFRGGGKLPTWHVLIMPFRQ